MVTIVPPARHLLRAKDLIDARYRERLDVPTLARAARLSPAHFSREFRKTFGETPHQYLLTRRLERAAALLRNTDRSISDICFDVGLRDGSGPGPHHNGREQSHSSWSGSATTWPCLVILMLDPS
jgi:AraC-like DNA-binding protein